MDELYTLWVDTTAPCVRHCGHPHQDACIRDLLSWGLLTDRRERRMRNLSRRAGHYYVPGFGLELWHWQVLHRRPPLNQ
eukprot:8541882-Pyramimonas_sp.AAC.1